MVWQAAQLSANSWAPVEMLAPFVFTTGIAGSEGSSELTNEAISIAWKSLRRAGLRGACTALAFSAGMRPVDTQKSMVAGPRPTRFGPRSVPTALVPWQLEQNSSKRA